MCQQTSRLPKSQSVRSGHSVVEAEVMPVISRTQPTLALKNRSTCSGRKVVKATVMVNQSVSGINLECPVKYFTKELNVQSVAVTFGYTVSGRQSSPVSSL